MNYLWSSENFCRYAATALARAVVGDVGNEGAQLSEVA